MGREFEKLVLSGILLILMKIYAMHGNKSAIKDCDKRIEDFGDECSEYLKRN